MARPAARIFDRAKRPMLSSGWSPVPRPGWAGSSEPDHRCPDTHGDHHADSPRGVEGTATGPDRDQSRSDYHEPASHDRNDLPDRSPPRSDHAPEYERRRDNWSARHEVKDQAGCDRQDVPDNASRRRSSQGRCQGES